MTKFSLQAPDHKVYTSSHGPYVRICAHGSDELELAEFHRDDVPFVCVHLAAEAGISHWAMRQYFADDDGPQGLSDGEV